jgi:hypothetical protein
MAIQVTATSRCIALSGGAPKTTEQAYTVLYEQTLGRAGDYTNMDSVTLFIGVHMETIHRLSIGGWICGSRKPGIERMSSAEEAECGFRI